jgi:hypothetical protein
MTATTREIIEKFAQLPISEKKIVVSVLLRDTLDAEKPELSDEELLSNAEEIFLELDRREAKESDFWLSASESSADEIWNNEEDDVYAGLLEK